MPGTASFPGSARVLTVTGALGLSLFVVDCIDTRADAPSKDAGTVEDVDAGEVNPPLAVDVTVDFTTDRGVVAPNHFGMHSSVYDNALHNPTLPGMLEESGITLLRYPGGGYSDNYHWSIHEMTPGHDGNRGYLGPRSDFGNYVSVIESFGGKIMITVNYGSNLQGDGPGEPKEAAAWVAYANGDPGNDYEIGVDGAGNDWRTVGYWAELRSSAALSTDDGWNFLRIDHPAPLGIEYWEIGNEVFGNGFHQTDGSPGFELDLHVPYPDPDAEEVAPELVRFGNELLSGTTYGTGVVAYIEEMKAVDPNIKVGAVLGTPPADDSWMRAVDGYYWNDDVLRECGRVIDFGIVHWYPNPPSIQTNDMNEGALYRIAGLLTYPRTVMPVMVQRLHDTFEENCGDNAPNVEIVMTEVGTGIRVPNGRTGTLDRTQAMGIFAADMYLTAAEQGFVNVDWLELHNGTFLNEQMTPTKGAAFNGIRMAHLLADPGATLVDVDSSASSLVVHAARREDGRVAVMLINTQPPELRAARVSVSLEGIEVGSSGEGYAYGPAPFDPNAFPPVDGGLDPALVHAAASGPIVGPTRFSNLGNQLVVDVPQYGVIVLLFDAN